MSTADREKYDSIFIGTSMICVLEAVYQSLCGKSVLMIDAQKDMGGAWLSLDLFGTHDVENAIHYFLPDPDALDFMRDVLTWEVVPSERKYQVFLLPFGSAWRIPYDHGLARFIGKVMRGAFEKKRAILPNLVRAIKESFFEKRQPSYYVRGGVPEMLSKVKAILSASDVVVRYSTAIDRIHIDNGANAVEVAAGTQVFRARTIVVTHGSRLPALSGPSGPVTIEEQLHPRPAVHLLIRDGSPPRMYECVFTADRLLKYVHDVTRFTPDRAELVGRKKILVLALHADVHRSEDLYEEIFARLKRVGMVGRSAILEGHYWQDVFLPRLGDDDLMRLKAEFGPQVEFLKTENFARGIGYHAARWASKIRIPAPQTAPPDQVIEDSLAVGRIR